MLMLVLLLVVVTMVLLLSLADARIWSTRACLTPSIRLGGTRSCT